MRRRISFWAFVVLVHAHGEMDWEPVFTDPQSFPVHQNHLSQVRSQAQTVAPAPMVNQP